MFAVISSLTLTRSEKCTLCSTLTFIRWSSYHITWVIVLLLSYEDVVKQNCVPAVSLGCFFTVVMRGHCYINVIRGYCLSAVFQHWRSLALLRKLVPTGRSRSASLLYSHTTHAGCLPPWEFTTYRQTDEHERSCKMFFAHARASGTLKT